MCVSIQAEIKSPLTVFSVSVISCIVSSPNGIFLQTVEGFSSQTHGSIGCNLGYLLLGRKQTRYLEKQVSKIVTIKEGR